MGSMNSNTPFSIIARGPYPSGLQSSLIMSVPRGTPMTPSSVASTRKPASPSELAADLILMS